MKGRFLMQELPGSLCHRSTCNAQPEIPIKGSSADRIGNVEFCFFHNHMRHARSHMHKDAKESTCLCLCFSILPLCVCSCLCVCVCVPQLYTQMTVILDDPDFPRLTLTVSQLSHSNLSLPFSPSVTHKCTGPDVMCILRAETHRKMPMHITHAHAEMKRK